MSYTDQETINKLVYEMGFDRAEVVMALSDSGGDLNKAIEKLLAGTYAPPPYEQSSSVSVSDVKIEEKSHNKVLLDDVSQETTVTDKIATFLTDLTKSKKIPEHKKHKDATAPSFYDLSNQLVDKSGLHQELPPPYEIVEKSKKLECWEKEFNVSHIKFGDVDKGTKTIQLSQVEGMRCEVCFSILKDLEKDLLFQNGKYYHGSCFRKKYGPKCSHCCFPLSVPDKDHNHSGRYLIYDGKDYHVECYEKYAGPRCSHCFDVIIERPNKVFTGSWIVDGNYQYHTECYQKKLQNYWKAKNS